MQNHLHSIKRSLASIVLITTPKCAQCEKIKENTKDIDNKLPNNTSFHVMSMIKWNRKMKNKLYADVPYFGLFYEGELIKIISKMMNERKILKLMDIILNPKISMLNTNLVHPFLEANRNVILLESTYRHYNFNIAAIYFFDYPNISFAWMLGNNSKISFLDYKSQRVEIFYENDNKLIDWIKNVTDQTPPLNLHFGSSGMLLSVVYGRELKETNALFGKLAIKVGSLLTFGYANWIRDASYISDCQISPNNRTYVILNDKLQCYPFVDDDVISFDLVWFWVSKKINGNYDRRSPLQDIPVTHGAIIPLNAENIRNKIPGKRACTVLHMSNSNSIDHPNVSGALAKSARNFMINNKIVFYEINPQYNACPSYLPNNDGFPMIVMYAPQDHRPHIFSAVFSPQALHNWIIETAQNVCNISINIENTYKI